MKKSTKVALGVTGGFILIGIAANAGNHETTAKPNDRAAVQAPAKSGNGSGEGESEKEPAKVSEPKKTQAQEFISCVNQSGTSAEKAAVKHVEKVTGADKSNGILDAAEVFTDLKGDMFDGNAGTGKLIASAFAGCYKSDNGLVTVYNSTGELLSNGNY